jgi:hypothetical protein
MPRGRKPEPNPRDIIITLRLTQREYRYLQGLALKHGRSLGAVVRFLALAGMPVASPPDAGEVGPASA